MAKKIKQRCYPNINGGKYLVGLLMTFNEAPGMEFCLIKEGKFYKMIECSTGLSLGVESVTRDSAIISAREKMVAKYLNGDTFADIVHRSKSNFQHFIDEKPMRLPYNVSPKEAAKKLGFVNAFLAIRARASRETLESLREAWRDSEYLLDDLIDCEIPQELINQLKTFIPSLNG